MDEKKPIGKDATGYEVLTAAVRDLLNQYPGLYEGEIVKFEELGETSGIAFSADSGALVYTETEDVCGGVTQTCRYPFFVVYRTAATREKQKLNVQSFLDTMGKWICREPAVIDGQEVRLMSWPKLAQGREIKRITRDNSYALEPNEDGVQDWLLPLTVEYTNQFEL